MYRRLIVPPVVRKSIRVVTVSNFEKERIKNFMELGDNLVAIYNGVGEHFRKIDDQEILLAAKTKYKLPDNFMFFLGNTDPKKNTPNVLKAFAEFNEQSVTKYKLVMLDYEENALQKILFDIGHPEMREDIHLAGYVVNTDLPAIINQCKVFLYPSLRESFGIPILEGMACGVPVITSNTSSMPEIAGDAAFIVDPHSSKAITNAIIQILEDDKLCKELCAKGMERAKSFSWRMMAERNLELYKEVYQEIQDAKN
jgi:glycosyltransferase involved in cell wall biosynthesis